MNSTLKKRDSDRQAYGTLSVVLEWRLIRTDHSSSEQITAGQHSSRGGERFIGAGEGANEEGGGKKEVIGAFYMGREVTTCTSGTGEDGQALWRLPWQQMSRSLSPMSDVITGFGSSLLAPTVRPLGFIALVELNQ